MKNVSAAPVSEVVLTSWITPKLPPTRLTGPCAPAVDAIRCRWQVLQPGEQAEGVIEVALPEDSHGPVHIKGRVTWHRISAATSATTVP
ncbi:hypothetical protein [Streptomyces flavidovirens]|uniref:DUF4139 domain-containing protein n=1 Tax=Streptomyces flavidovirens TaxID=67298 RepID=A0ABW6RQ71_9ACTN